ncbi:hypothetical protein SAMD00019534_093340 [Acytostelium subglobosum LB1]|uniref:hypothetical protein n=1 Tax=Acytostelium subglobosum LB1 TaxID=1410327 RepID=UPI000644F3F5|nr:hypothetical protein SAMD00019534_093340 [Acytostelium subglobosum LB1]GAM26159.1 hypothetical protein SAMD00019534_093340 [Acytostelium subglobosum LB1]|eukprot:XP_012750713.1 hypothetical protein SAMD00019534_093340 [Acytostelium subglobosum LB1]
MVVYLITHHETRQARLASDSDDIPLKSRKVSSVASPSGKSTSNIVDDHDDNNSWCPKHRQVLSIGDVINKHAKVTGSPQETDLIVGIIGGATEGGVGSNVYNTLTIRDQHSSIPILLSSKCHEAFYSMDTVVLVTKWQLVSVSAPKQQQ